MSMETMALERRTVVTDMGRRRGLGVEFKDGALGHGEQVQHRPRKFGNREATATQDTTS